MPHPTKLGKQSNIDPVVVGPPGGVFVISTKGHRGLFSGTAQGLLHNGQRCDFAKDAQRQTMNLRQRLESLMGRDVPDWVQPVVAVPFGYTEHDPFEGKVWLVNAEEIVGRIAPDKVTKRLAGGQVERVAKVLEMLQAGAADAYERPAPQAEGAR